MFILTLLPPPHASDDVDRKHLADIAARHHKLLKICFSAFLLPTLHIILNGQPLLNRLLDDCQLSVGPQKGVQFVHMKNTEVQLH